jgi:hypothetical protein
MVLRLALAALLIPAAAHAGKLTAGVSIGSSHDQKHDDAGIGGSQTVGLFGRLALTPRLSGQLELGKYDHADGSGTVIRTATALLVVDLTAGKQWVPTLMVGMGIDRADLATCTVCAGDFDSQSARHIEGGFGLEYRAAGGFTIGADFRLGGRSIDDEQIGIQEDIALFRGGRLQASEYRAGRVWAGVRF